MANRPKPTVEELQKKLDRMYRTAFYYELVDSKAQFAELVELTAQNLSSAFSGNPRFISENILNRAERNVREALSEKGVEYSGTFAADEEVLDKSADAKQFIQLRETIETLEKQTKELSTDNEQLKYENVTLKTEASLYKELYQRLLEHIMPNGGKQIDEK